MAHERKHFGHNCLALLVLVVLMALPINAKQQTQEEDRAEVLTEVQKRMQQEVTVDFSATPIEQVLHILATEADIDIVKSPDVIGDVTATLTDVPLAEALDNILAAHGYGYVATENMIRIMPRSAIIDIREKIVSRVYRITYADALEVEKALSKFISDQGSVSVNVGTSNIIVTDTESKVKAIDEFIAEIDRETPQILVEARIYDISTSDRLDFGIEWTLGRNTTFGETLGSTDTTGKTDPFVTGIVSGVVNQATDSIGLLRFGILNGSLNIDAILRAEQENISAKLLACPRILVLDNESAQIKIVEEIPFQKLTESALGGTIGTTEFREVGVDLTVTPHVTRDGKIRLRLNPIFSVQTGQVLVVTAGSGSTTPQPIIATRETRTTALIQSKQTVVIGGMRKQDISQQKNKIPILGDIPLLGALFRSEGEETVTSELVIFITPTIITDPILTDREQYNLTETDFPLPDQPVTRLGPGKE